MKNLPKGWTACEVSTVAEVNPRKPKAAPEELVSFVGMADVSEEMRLVNHAPRPYAEVANGFTGFEDNDILVAKITPCFENGKGALVTGLTNGKGFGSTEFHVVRAEDESTRRLLYHHFSTHEFRVRGEANMTGSAGQKRIPTSFISKYVVPLPPQATREKIVAILDACDRAIDGTDKLLEKQEKRFDVLLHGLLGDEAGKLLERATSWPMTPLGEVGEVVSGGTPDSANRAFWDGDVAWCTPTDITALKGDKYLSGTARSITPQGLANSSAKLLPVNSVLVCTRATVGECVINTIPVATNQGFKNIIPHSIQTEFLYYALMARKQKLISLGSGSTFLEVSKKDFVKLEIPTPDDATQTAVSRVLAAADREIAISKLLIQQHQQQKKGLMQRLLTGQAFIH
ncbi:restriction endonuclease subunit S [Hymenobacter defluvii]|uniref:Restriction endonuclease subunit S n=1 Tax=Hymenobacter defluvii TaxID=2054411 RepID=A0ABS3TEE8_9BACT|nr:restriction endonuclease subunit S [Hymenobacter defluvii]MBO3272012.1 restriction endonuclease subunit S [Hymenobacter defluvii]